MGVENFGKYTLVLTFITFSYIITDWGLSTLTIRDVAREPSETRTYIVHTTILRLVFGIIWYLILMGLILLLSYPIEILSLTSIAGLSILTNNILGGFNAIFSAHEKMYIPSIMGIIFSTLFLLFGIISLWLGLGLIGLMLTIVVLSMANTILTGWLLKGSLLPIRFSLDYPFYRKLIKSATPYAILSILSIIYFRIDSIMLSKLKTMEAVGLYNAGYKIVESLMFIPISLMGAYFPRMSKEARYSPSHLRRSYFRTTGLLLTFIIPVAIITTIFAKDIIIVLFGKEFLPTKNALRILIWAVVVMYINAPIGNILYSSDRLFGFIPYAILNTLLNIILNFISIPRWSYIGASFTTLITEITGFFIQILFVRDILFRK